MNQQKDLLDWAETLLCSACADRPEFAVQWLEGMRKWRDEKHGINNLPWWHWSRYFGQRKDHELHMKISELKAAVDRLNDQLLTLTVVVTNLKIASSDPDVPQNVADGIAKANDAIKTIIAG